MTKLLTPQQAADVMGVSKRTIERLVDEAQAFPRTARWKEKREFVVLSSAGSIRRKVRIFPEALGLTVSEIG